MPPRRGRDDAQGDSLFAGAARHEPLAARLRPRTLDEYVGQGHLLAPGKPLRVAIESGRVTGVETTRGTIKAKKVGLLAARRASHRWLALEMCFRPSCRRASSR